MALVNTNAQFAPGTKNVENNFAGTAFAAGTESGPQTAGLGVDANNSNWIATIYSKKVLNFFRTASVVEGVTNND
jgi:hypothetical protein